MQSFQQVDRLPHFTLVQAGHDLVQQHDVGFERQRARHFEPAPFAQGQVAGAHTCVVRETDRLQHRHGLVARGAQRAVAHECADHHVLQRIQRDQRFGDLEGAPHAEPGPVMRRQLVDALAAQAHFARRRRKLPRQQVEKGGLAGTVGADDADDLALAHRQRDVVDGAQAKKMLAHLGDGQEIGAHFGPLRRFAPVPPGGSERLGNGPAALISHPPSWPETRASGRARRRPRRAS